ncbi:MAG: hypothetical protein AAGF53_10080 [Pseudomonadota bacterium]
MILADFLPVIKSVHLVSVLACLLVVMFVDLRASKLFITPLLKRDFVTFEVCHRVLNIGLIVLWSTGTIITLELLKYDILNMTPKLLAKITVVTILTANASLIGRYVLPYLKLRRGSMMGDFDPQVRVWLSITFSMSFASWMAAFCLGMFPIFRPMDASQLLLVLGNWYIAMIGIGLVIAFVAPHLNPSERVHMQSWQRRTKGLREKCAGRVKGHHAFWRVTKT